MMYVKHITGCMRPEKAQCCGILYAQTIHSGNLYQIFTYVKNKEQELSDQPHAVSGMLLYAKTDEALVPNQRYKMNGNQIAVSSLDLSMEFDGIRAQLDAIVDEFFRS